MIDPLISVIVPVFNKERYLEICIESILCQDYKNLEIIIIDDGSTDGSGELCDDLQQRDKRIRVIHQRNAGVSTARNVGIEASSGGYVSFVDADDMIRSDMIRVLFESMGDCEVACCGHATSTRFDKTENHSELKKTVYKITGKEYCKRLLKIHAVGEWQYVCTKLFRKDIISDIQFDQNISDGEDLLFMYQVAQRTRQMSIIDEKLYFYRQRNGLSYISLKEWKRDFLNAAYCMRQLALESQNQEIIKDADYFCKRAEFNMLCRAALSDEHKRIFKSEEARNLLNATRNNYWNLMHSKMPYTRKIALSAFVLFPSFTGLLLRVLYQIKNIVSR